MSPLTDEQRMRLAAAWDRQHARTIPPWWANPIVFVPAIVTAAFLLAGVAIALLVGAARG